MHSRGARSLHSMLSAAVRHPFAAVLTIALTISDGLSAFAVMQNTTRHGKILPLAFLGKSRETPQLHDAFWRRGCANSLAVHRTRATVCAAFKTALADGGWIETPHHPRRLSLWRLRCRTRREARVGAIGKARDETLNVVDVVDGSRDRFDRA